MLKAGTYKLLIAHVLYPNRTVQEFKLHDFKLPKDVTMEQLKAVCYGILSEHLNREDFKVIVVEIN